jgi:hypothetical protein
MGTLGEKLMENIEVAERRRAIERGAEALRLEMARRDEAVVFRGYLDQFLEQATTMIYDGQENIKVGAGYRQFWKMFDKSIMRVDGDMGVNPFIVEEWEKFSDEMSEEGLMVEDSRDKLGVLVFLPVS